MRKGECFMKVIKGIIIGGMISAGLVMMYGETMGFNKKKMMKQGKRMIKKMGC